MNKKLLILAALAAAIVTGIPLYGQYASLSLDLKFTLYASDEGRNFYPTPKEGEVGIVFAKGTLDESFSEAKLGQLFNLNKVRMAGETEMDVHWPGEEIPNSRIAHALRVNGRDFLVVLFPDKVSFKENVYTFKAEVYDLDPKADPAVKSICRETIDLNVFGFVGFFFKDKTYFLTLRLLRSGGALPFRGRPSFSVRRRRRSAIEGWFAEKT